MEEFGRLAWTVCWELSGGRVEEDLREEIVCLGLDSGFWKHEEEGGDFGCLGTVLGSGMQVFGEL